VELLHELVCERDCSLGTEKSNLIISISISSIEGQRKERHALLAAAFSKRRIKIGDK